jgi:hypothetical protein
MSYQLGTMQQMFINGAAERKEALAIQAYLNKNFIGKQTITKKVVYDSMPKETGRYHAVYNFSGGLKLSETFVYRQQQDKITKEFVYNVMPRGDQNKPWFILSSKGITGKDTSLGNGVFTKHQIVPGWRDSSESQHKY